MGLSNWYVKSAKFARSDPSITVGCTATVNTMFADILPYIGGWQTISGEPQYIVPKSFAELPSAIGGGLSGNFATFRCNSITPTLHLGTDKDGTGYQYAEIEMEFGQLLESVADDNCQSAIIKGEISIEGLALPQGAYTWTSGTNSGKVLDPDKDVQPQLWLPYIALEVDFPFKPTLPLPTFSDYAGTVNSDDVIIAGFTFSAGQLIFQGCPFEPAMSGDGTLGWTRPLKFGARQDDWNMVYSPADDAFESVTPTLYDTTDLNDVLTA